jgi:hypothetical protein
LTNEWLQNIFKCCESPTGVPDNGGRNQPDSRQLVWAVVLANRAKSITWNFSVSKNEKVPVSRTAENSLEKNGSVAWNAG